MKKYVYKVDGFIGCATAIGMNILATCYHCINHCIVNGPGLDENKCHREALINLSHVITGHKIKAKIRIYSIIKDIALLETIEDELMNANEVSFEFSSWLGQPYYILVSKFSIKVLF